MRDSKKTAIEGIENLERHLYNYKLLHKFLCKNKNYIRFKNIFFLNQNRDYIDVIKRVATYPNPCPVYKCSSCNRIDGQWSAFFNYIPYSGGVWCKYHLDSDEMNDFCCDWGKYIDEHNYDKLINKKT